MGGELLRGLPPIVVPGARVLLLGSFPGARSLAARQYYANPHNRFWPAVATLTGIAPTAPYGERIAGLRRAGIALWDVLAACAREGSLDADIAPGSERPNDFARVLARHPTIHTIAFNGKSPSRYFDRLVAPLDVLAGSDLRVLFLPSTSPAHAAMRPAELTHRWHDLLAPLLSRD